MRRRSLMVAMLCVGCTTDPATSADRLSILRGLGNGRFADPRPISHVPLEEDETGDDPAEIVVGDFDGNGSEDIAWRDLDAASVHLVLTDPDGSLERLESPLPFLPARLQVADVEPDGRADLLALSDGAAGVTVLRSGGDGTFAPLQTHEFPGLRSIAVADLTADGVSDLVALSSSNLGTRVSVLGGNGVGRFDPVGAKDVGGTFVRGLPANLDGDSAADLLLLADPTGFSYMRNDGTGQLGSVTAGYPLFGKDCFHVVDVDADGLDDVLGSPGATVLGNLGGWFEDEPTGFDITRPLPCGPLIDLDGDAQPDFVRIDDRELRVLAGDGRGFGEAFVTSINLTGEFEVLSWAGGDVDGNGHGDLVLLTRTVAEPSGDDGPMLPPGPVTGG